MQKIIRIDDLERYGIVLLTGEACGLMYRILFDVTARGRAILEKCFSVNRIELASPWNTGKDQDPHIGSIMLAREMLVPVGIFALLESGCTEVWRKEDSLFGIEPSDSREWCESFKKVYGPFQRFAYQGTAGDRNIHQMSGRVS